MHRVVKGHLDDFEKKHTVSDQLSKQFEAFLNYVVFRTHSAESVEPRDLVYDGDDPGIDGVMVFVDDSYVSSVEEVEDSMAERRRDADVTICFTQAKTSESWAKKEINAFESAINDFLSDQAAYPHSEYMKNAREVFDAVLKHVGKIRDGRPRAQAFFATTARASDDREILAARKAIQTSLENSGLFSSVEVELINRDSVVEMWNAAEGQIEATLQVLGSAAFPRTPSIQEAYVVTVKASDFVQQILSDRNGRLRQRIFNENVRDFLGSEGVVNREMSDTITDHSKQKRFGILNNGVTMISPDVRVGSFEVFVRDFQIVNGCQTSNVLFENRALIGDDATLMLKLIETSDPAVVDDIVRSTNRQAQVDEDQFLATLDAVKALERYFEARGKDDDLRLYFERRRNQYSHIENAKPIRVFDIKEIARCVAAMFLDKPDIASRYPNKLTGEMRKLVFDSSYLEDVYHTAAYTLYRLKLLISNNRIDQKYSKLRWHLIMALKYYVVGSKIPDLSSPKVKAISETIESFMSSGNEETVNKIRDLCLEVVDLSDITRDRIKGASLAAEVKARAIAFREIRPPYNT